MQPYTSTQRSQGNQSTDYRSINSTASDVGAQPSGQAGSLDTERLPRDDERVGVKGSNLQHEALASSDNLNVPDPVTGGPSTVEKGEVDVSLHQTYDTLLEIRSQLRNYHTSHQKPEHSQLEPLKTQYEAIEANTLKTIFVSGGAARLPAGERHIVHLSHQIKHLFKQLGVHLANTQPDRSHAQNPHHLTDDQLSAQQADFANPDLGQRKTGDYGETTTSGMTASPVVESPYGLPPK